MARLQGQDGHESQAPSTISAVSAQIISNKPEGSRALLLLTGKEDVQVYPPEPPPGSITS